MPCRCSSQPPEPEPIAFYRELKQDETYLAPRRWRELDVGQFDALFLVGGHAPGMRQYLGSAVVHRLVGEFWRLERPVAAICHGVLVLARTLDPATGASVLRDRRITCLPRYMERSAF